MCWGTLLDQHARHAANDVRTPVEERMHLARLYSEWIGPLSQNLRLARKAGPSPDDFAELATSAETLTRTICAAEGWGPAPERAEPKVTDA